MKSKQLIIQLVKDIENNVKLSKRGLAPITIDIRGEHGIGKTEIVKQVAKTVFGEDYVFIYLSMGQMEDSADFVGYPRQDVIIQKEDRTLRVPIQALNAAAFKDWVIKDTVSVVSQPEWTKKCKPYKTVILLDDYTRANPIVLQALMAFLQEGKLGDWSTPPGTTIVLTTNPDINSKTKKRYQVTQMDEAQSDRMITYELDFDVKEWADWAYNYKDAEGKAFYPEVLINYAVEFPETFRTVSARAYECFMKAFIDPEMLQDKIHLKNHASLLGVSVYTGLLSFMASYATRAITVEEYMTKSEKELKAIFKKYILYPEIQALVCKNLVAHYKEYPDTKEHLLNLWRYNLCSKELLSTTLIEIMNTIPAGGNFVREIAQLK